MSKHVECLGSCSEHIICSYVCIYAHSDCTFGFWVRKVRILCNDMKFCFNSARHPVFVKCNKAVNYKQFVSKCMESTCECLRAHPGEDNTCKCNALQDFVAKCLTINPNIQLNLWRAVQQCGE